MNTALLTACADEVGRRLGHPRPIGALVLGSGWAHAVEPFPARAEVPYTQMACLGAPGVSGHPGCLRLVERAGDLWLVFLGRRHWYEGLGWEPVAFPVHLARQLGARILVLTNASGAIRADLTVGDLVVIDDHINHMGAHPLIGPHDPAWGPRFPDQSAVYDPALRACLHRAADAAGQRLAHGVYMGVSGPAYETPAEIRAYRSMGADLIGMSTVPEAALGYAAGLRVAALACVTNRAAGLGQPALAHAEVMAATAAAAPRMQALLARSLPLLAAEANHASRPD